MNNRIANRQALIAGLVLMLIFIAVSSNYTVHGAEPGQAPAVKRSRMHPKRIFSGFKRSFSKVFRSSEKKPAAPVIAEKATPRTTVSEQINHIYAERGLQPSNLARRPEQTITPVSGPEAAPERSPQVVSASKIDDSLFDDLDQSGIAATAAPKAHRSRAVVSNKISQAASRREAPQIKHMLGYCAVNLKYGKFRRGNRAYREVYQGRTYLFDSAEALEEFRRDPTPYAPVLQGIDVVELTHTGQHSVGFLSFSCDYDGHFYFFRTQENQEEFLANPSAYSIP